MRRIFIDSDEHMPYITVESKEDLDVIDNIFISVFGIEEFNASNSEGGLTVLTSELYKIREHLSLLGFTIIETPWPYIDYEGNWFSYLKSQGYSPYARFEYENIC